MCKCQVIVVIGFGIRSMKNSGRRTSAYQHDVSRLMDFDDAASYSVPYTARSFFWTMQRLPPELWASVIAAR